MIGVDEALARLLALAPDALDRMEEVPLMDAAGRPVLRDVTSLRTQPARALSAMDGYAVRGAAPWAIMGESAAGTAWHGALQDGECVRIFTGAVVPDGTACVVMQEDVALESGKAVLANAVSLAPGRHVRPAGGDFSAGDVLIKAGDILSPPRLALAASGGHARLPIARTLKLGLISTGNELRLPGEPCSEEQIPASNGVMLASLLALPGVAVEDLGIVPDDRAALRRAFSGASGCDVIVSIGGASVGDHDLVRPVLLDLGAQLDVWKVAMKPGKPLMFGTLGASIVVGLPGNPVSAHVTAMLFLMPLLRRMAGQAEPLLNRGELPLAAPLPANGNRTDHVRARIVDGAAQPVGINDSAALKALSRADCLIVRSAGCAATGKGEKVPVIFLT